MPYVTSQRVSGSRISSLESLIGDTLYARIDSPTDYQGTYSFRTGSLEKYQWVGSSVIPDLSSELYKPQGNIVEKLAYRRDFINRQVTKILLESQSAPTHFLLGDMGHEFGTVKMSCVASENSWTRDYYGQYRYRMRNLRPYAVYMYHTDQAPVMTDGKPDPFGGYFGPKGLPFSTQGSSFGATMGSLRGLGANHISEMSPFKQNASILAALIELARGDIPNVLKTIRQHMDTITRIKASGVKDAASALGSEYLNNVFGWAPIIRDVERAINTFVTIDNLLFPEDSTRRKVKRVIHTNGTVFKDSSGIQFGPTWTNGIPAPDVPLVTSAESNNPAFSYYMNVGSGMGEWSVLEELSVYTTARFNTGLRPNRTNNTNLDRAIDLLGLEITPEVLWELTPWSWLVDWFSNMGTVIGNLTNLGLSNTILNYAYSTARWKSRSSVEYTPQKVYSHDEITGKFLYSYTHDYKVRIGASPFGFDVALDSLSAGQWAILAALGLARSR